MLALCSYAILILYRYRQVVAQTSTASGGVRYIKALSELRVQATVMYRVRVGTSLQKLTEKQSRAVLRWAVGLADADPKKKEAREAREDSRMQQKKNEIERASGIDFDGDGVIGDVDEVQ